MLAPRWRNFISIKHSLNAVAPAAAHSVGFHSTPLASQKWKNKWDSDIGKGQKQQPTKDYIRFSVREKRTDTKKALKDLLYRSGCSRYSLEDEAPIRKSAGTEAGHLNDIGGYGKKARAKYTSRHASKNHYKKKKQKIQRDSFTKDFEGHPERTFHATFGNTWYSWSYTSDRSSTFENPAYGFAWGEQASSRNQWSSKWESISDMESEDEDDTSIGSCSDRRTLGLPLRGPLRLEEVKIAFRLCALKWHPDKHQGPSQSVAEEKFKSCVNAYKSLCGALSTA